jgi:DNA-binding transcriptional LysR family regulator
VRIGYSWSVRFETPPAIGRHLRSCQPGIDLLTQEMRNARLPDALADGTIDITIALCPEVASELEFEPIRSEPLVALLPADHALAGEQVLPLESLADEEFVLFPRELAPRLHDAFMAIYRRAASNRDCAANRSTPAGTSASSTRSPPPRSSRHRSRQRRPTASRPVAGITASGAGRLPGVCQTRVSLLRDG